jgi:hypothetical protein
VNTGNVCFANAVLQLLARSPPFWNIFRELGDLKGRRGGGDLGTVGGMTPLLDATARFFEEFTLKEEPLRVQQSPQHATGRRPREGKKAKKVNNAVDSLEPTYMYDAMREKRQLKNLLVRFRATSRRSVTDLCRNNAYRTAISMMQKSFSACTSTLLMMSCLPYSHRFARTRQHLLC